MASLNNYNDNEDKSKNIISLLTNQLASNKPEIKIDDRFDYNKPPIKSGLESLFEGNIKMPFGEDILFLQSEAIKAGPDEYNKFLKRYLNRTIKKKWVHNTIDFN